MRIRLLIITALCFCHLGDARSGKAHFEIGMKMGLPVFMVPIVGLWRPLQLPVVLRIGSILLTSEADFGYVLDSDGDYRQYLSACAGATAYSDGTLYWYGLKYGGIYKFFFAEVGVANTPTGHEAYEFIYGRDPQIHPIIQFGVIAHM